MVGGPAASESGNYLEMQIFRPQNGPTEPEVLCLEPRILFLKSFR